MTSSREGSHRLVAGNLRIAAVKIGKIGTGLVLARQGGKVCADILFAQWRISNRSIIRFMTMAACFYLIATGRFADISNTSRTTALRSVSGGGSASGGQAKLVMKLTLRRT
ncbi:hypothetical protein DSM3645_23910 [Blastopirellula marina DSM 3645]|uniref:Uncharacterized protein n=1 Tax=Blastopirellula marina DSM 3645 TaxID=314230 RepID=A4A1J4_9BACT|nr:hypothetical protein DSM3645_23910 [Blastopirellula marina DSM 3645]